MAYESIPLNWEMLSLLGVALMTGTGGAWKVAHSLGKSREKELEARLSGCAQRSETLTTDLQIQTLKVDRLRDQLLDRDRLIQKLEIDLGRGMGPDGQKTIEELKRRVKNFDELRDALLGAEDEVWKLRATQPPPDFMLRMQRSRTKVITVINYKGGVGKTTIVAGLAAYLAKRGKRVCVIDFDYQGSLTRTLILGGRLPLGRTILADTVIGGDLDGKQFINLGRDLSGTLPGASLITCGQSFDGFEYRTMLRWLLGETNDDVRFRLAKLILTDEVQQDIDYVLIDAPPRSSTGAINALCASHALIVPTVLDSLSVDAVGSFLARVTASFRSLNPSLEFAGVVGTLTKAGNMNAAEQSALEEARRALSLWGARSHLFTSRLRHFTALSQAAGRDVGYLQDRGVRQAFDALGDELIGELDENESTARNARGSRRDVRDERRTAESSVATSIQ